MSTKLNKKNYYTIKNRYLSNSKISDYLKDPEYFKEKHIDGTWEKPELTDALIIGSAVDMWLTEGKMKFKSTYYEVSRRNKNDNKIPYEYQLNPTMYKNIERMCSKVRKKTIFKQLRGFNKQEIISCKMDIGKHFTGLCGIPDWFKLSDDETYCVIVDLKTAKTVNETKYHYHCLDYGYYRQQAVYQIILSANNPFIQNFASYHVVVEKDTDKIFNVRVFRLNQKRIEFEKQFVMDIVDKIKNDKNFKSPECSFDSASEIGGLEENKLSDGWVEEN